MSGSSNVLVEVAVPQVIDGAARSSHDESTEEEDGRCGENSEGRCDGTGLRGGEEGGEQAWQEEVVGPHWFVQADEFCVGY
jgi:hypothetical protein